MSHASDLHQFVQHFSQNKLKEHYEEIKYPSSQALILLGAPGQGKTSFCKRVLHDFIENETHSTANIYYIKLRDIHNSDFLAKPFSYLIEDKFFPETTDKNLEEALIIFDGLDELYLHNGGHLSEVDAFIQTLLQQLKAPRYAKAKLIITSRFGYLSLDKLDRENNVSIACIDTFDESQQIEWIENYQKAFPDKEIQLNADKIRAIHTKPLYQKQPLIHFQELFEQPVLLHIFVLSGLKVNLNTQRTQIYSQLFEKLSKRAWEKEPSQALKRVNPLQLKEIAKAIAFKMYKNKQTFLNKKALDSIPEVKNFYTTLDIRGEEQKKELYRYLFIAFYWQKKNNTEDEVLEFLHKSLQEYLIAEKIWDQFQKIAEDSCTSPSHALESIWSFAAPQMIPKEVREILVEIIDNDPKDRTRLLEKMKAYFPDLLEKQFMQECLPTEPIKGGVHTFYLYFLVLNTLHFKVYSSMDVEEPAYLNLKTFDWSFSNLFQTTQLYYSRVYWNLNCSFIHDYMQFSYGLFFSKIEAVKFKQISFHDIKFHKTSFNQSILEQVRMTKTSFRFCSFNEAQFHQLDATEIDFRQNNCVNILIKRSQIRPKSIFSDNLFTSAKIIDTTFNQVEIGFTSFKAAIFYEKRKHAWGGLQELKSSFGECTFKGCSFEKADLTCVSFNKTKIYGSSFENAIITRANFSKAVFEDGLFPKDFEVLIREDQHPDDLSNDTFRKFVSFNSAEGKNVYFREATLKGVTFENAVLEQVDFSYATIESFYYNSISFKEDPLECSSSFKQASLIKANFHEAKLRGVNFDYATLKNANFLSAVIENHIHEDYNAQTQEEEEVIIYTSFKKTNLEGANFRGATLKNINFQEANLTKSNLANLDLSGCSFYNANLQQVDLSCSLLKDVNFEGADLTGVQWFNEFFQSLKAVDDGYAKIEPIENTNTVQIITIIPNTTLYFFILQQTLEQIKAVKSLYNAKGIPEEWKKILQNQGFEHLFENPNL